MAIDVVLADDAEHFRRGLSAIIGGEPGLRVVGEAPDGVTAVRLVTDLAPDVAIIDLRMPGMDGVAVTRAIREVSPVTRVLILTVSDDGEELRAAFIAGAHGYLLKDTAIDDVPDAVRQVAHGGSPLSPAIAAALWDACVSLLSGADSLQTHEREVLRLLAEGASVDAIADTLAVQPVVVSHRVRDVLEKVHRARLLQEVVMPDG